MEYTRNSVSYKFPSVVLAEILDLTLKKLKCVLDRGKINIQTYDRYVRLYVKMYQEAIEDQRIDEMISLLSLVLELEEFEAYLHRYEKK